MKTKKAISKRIKLTKNGKLVARKAGGNHFNAKESRVKQLDRRLDKKVSLTPKQQSRFIPHGTN
jgi:ribosomal protein L35